MAIYTKAVLVCDTCGGSAIDVLIDQHGAIVGSAVDGAHDQDLIAGWHFELGADDSVLRGRHGCRRCAAAAHEAVAP